MKYRREIDGLRAIAVLPVIFFHAGFKAFGGGFVGVDIFFVISGYLITTIILAEMEKGTFSLVTFYERRARRILPALFFVMLCSLPFAWLWLLPDDLRDFSKSIAAVSAFSSNILFLRESGYFDVSAELKPLLHTWSLSVEEQYYVLFPLFLMLMWRFRKRLIFISVLLISATSLLLAQWGTYSAPAAAFYLIPMRGWELAIGALIAFYFLYKKEHVAYVNSNRVASELFSVLGIALISYSIFTFDKSTPFPGFYALIPTIGAGLVIVFSSPLTLVGRLLGTRLMVGVGLISYSTYLWHHLLFVFARHRSLAEPSAFVYLFLAILSIVLAYFSWRYIEVPFRNKDIFNRKRIFSIAVIGTSTFIIVGLFGDYSNGWPERIPKNITDLTSRAREVSQKESIWLARPGQFIEAKNSYSSQGKSKRFAYLVGDSHAEALAEALEIALSNNDVGFSTLTYSGCPPIKGVYRTDEENDHRCKEYNDSIYSYIASTKSIEYVILSARWTLYLDGDYYDNQEGGVEYSSRSPVDLIVNTEKQKNNEQQRMLKVKDAYLESVKFMLSIGKKVIIVDQVPEAGWDVPKYIFKRQLYSSEETLPLAAGSTSYPLFLNRNKDMVDLWSKLGKHQNLVIVKPEQIFCNTYLSERCVVSDGYELFYRDSNHLSAYGANILAKQIEKFVN